jgi:hypothetical protein
MTETVSYVKVRSSAILSSSGVSNMRAVLSQTFFDRQEPSVEEPTLIRAQWHIQGVAPEGRPFTHKLSTHLLADTSLA